MAEYPDTRQDKLSWTSGFVKIDNLHMPSFKYDNFDAEMNHDSDVDSKDFATVFINSDSENLNFMRRISELLRYILRKEKPLNNIKNYKTVKEQNIFHSGIH